MDLPMSCMLYVHSFSKISDLSGSFSFTWEKVVTARRVPI